VWSVYLDLRIPTLIMAPTQERRRVRVRAYWPTNVRLICFVSHRSQSFATSSSVEAARHSTCSWRVSADCAAKRPRSLTKDTYMRARSGCINAAPRLLTQRSRETTPWKRYGRP
jgi:hypothetical protein